jgi:hypothetical protein
LINKENLDVSFEDLVVILLCSSHTAATWKEIIKKHCKNLTAEQFRILAAIMGCVYNLSTISEADKLARIIFTVLLKKKMDAGFM